MIIEGTSRCTLACPGCPRTWFSETFNRPFPKFDLDVESFYRFMDCDSGRAVKEFSFNGNHGDVIYWPDLFLMLEKFRSSKHFRIMTNGSHQKDDFWHRLKDILGPEDTVFFSIDGLEHTNHLYRKNADWASIMRAIDIMKNGTARLIWKSLIFSFNENDIDIMRKRASDLGMLFTVDPTSRFGDESLAPSLEKQLHDRRYTNDQSHQIELAPRCSSLEYVSASGHYWPCCMISSFYTLHKTWLWKEKNLWHIDHQNLDQARVRLETTKRTIVELGNQADPVCKMHCKKNQFDYPWGSM